MKRKLENLDTLGREQLKRFKKMPKNFREALKNIPVKRARKVASRILEVGYCTTEWLQSEGYEHAPRAARDLRERGFQLETLYYKADNGRAMAVYVFGDFVQTQKQTKSHGRMAINSKIKKELLKKHGNICSIWLEKIPAEELQVDHRIPFEIAGEVDEIGNYESYMLVSASANRQKSWTCEHCNNWQVKNKNTCKTCFWAYPENYTHVAGRSGIVLPIRLMDNSVVKKYEEEVKKHGAEETRHRIEYAVIKFLEEEET